MTLIKLLPVIGVLTLAGCATGGRCVGEFDYQKAETVAPIRAADGVKAPESGSALRIPPAPSQPVPLAEHVADPDKPGKTKVHCLDTPPAMQEPATPPAITPAADPAPKS